MKRLPTSPFAYYRVTGTDRIEWLQGQLTQDVASMKVGEGRRTAILTATGQLMADGAIWRFEEEAVLGLDRLAAGVADALEQKIVMEDVVIESLTEGVESLICDEAQDFPARFVLPIDHVGVPGWDLLGAGPIEAETIDYEIARIEAAVPLAGIDYTIRTLAMEMGEAFVSSRIAFGKGCYTGQEIVERIRSRGHTNRSWVGFVSEAPITNVPDATLTSATVSPRFGPIGLGFVRNEHSEPGTALGGVRVVSLPFK